MAKYRVPVLHSFCWQEAVKTRQLIAAPSNPMKGDRYIVPMSGITPDDVWEGHESSIAWYDGCDWKYDIPDNGWHTYVQNELADYFFNGEAWERLAGAGISSVGLYVDNNREDLFIPNGSFSCPYKNINDAVNHIIEAADNTREKGYVINIFPGNYTEDVLMDSTSLVNVTFRGSGVANTFINSDTTSTSLKSISNNDSFKSLVLQGITFLDDVELRGASNGTLFGSETMEIKQCQFSDSNLILQNINNPVLDDTSSTGNVLWSNINNGIISGNRTFSQFTIESDKDGFKPAGWLGDDYGTVLQNIGHRIDDLSFSSLNGGKIYISMRNGGSVSSTVSNIPENVTLSLHNSTLKGTWTLDGMLELNSGSYVTGDLIENDGSVLNISGQKSSQLSIGSVPDGNQLTDGIIPLPSENNVAWALDEFNEILKCMAPPEADPLTDVDLICDITQYTGKLPSGLNSRWYQDGKNAGDTISVIIQDNMVLKSGEGEPYNFEEPQTVPFVPLTTNSARFRQGNKGTLKVKHNDGGEGLNVVATLDIESNFIENDPGVSPRYPEVQDLSQWNTTVDLTNNRGSLEITDVRTYNEFCLWQKMNAQINIENIDEGFNSFSLLHDNILPTSEESNEFKIFYDNDTSSLSFGTSPTIVESSIFSSKYISGIRYYSLDDRFNVTYVGDNVYKKIYHVNEVSSFIFDATNGSKVCNPTSLPNVNGSLSVDEIITINVENYYDLDARVTAILNHPWKSPVVGNSPSENRYVCTFGDVSTDTEEWFLDEKYRLPNGNYDTIPSSIINQWNSQTDLNNGEALVFNHAVQFPNHNASSSLPSGNPNYSTGFSGDQVYLRAFRDISNPHNSMVLTLYGIELSDVSPVGTGDLNIEVKLPSQTGWLDVAIPFNVAIFNGNDGDGCRVSVDDNNWDITFGTFSTARSGNLVIIKITFRNTNCKIHSTMAVNW